VNGRLAATAMLNGGAATLILHYRLSPIRIGTAPAPGRPPKWPAWRPAARLSKAAPAFQRPLIQGCGSFVDAQPLLRHLRLVQLHRLTDTSVFATSLHSHNRAILLSFGHSPSRPHVDGIDLPRIRYASIVYRCPLLQISRQRNLTSSTQP
jgi:hypothetical protein